MKKALALIMALLLMIPCLSAYAADSADVYVTISDDIGALVLTRAKIHVTDVDADGALTINDALYAAHEAKFEGGAAAGFASGETQYGLSLNKLWGIENGGSYGYYVNNASAMSLSDAIADGDSIQAFVYTDLTAWSDAFSFFNESTVSAKDGEAIELTLSTYEYDANWNKLVVPVEGAVITVNGTATDYKTDAAGKAVITIDGTGIYTISAASDTKTLVPPVCIAAVTTAAAPVVTPDTGADSAASIYAVAFAVALIGLAVLTVRNRKSYEK